MRYALEGLAEATPEPRGQLASCSSSGCISCLLPLSVSPIFMCVHWEVGADDPFSTCQTTILLEKIEALACRFRLSRSDLRQRWAGDPGEGHLPKKFCQRTCGWSQNRWRSCLARHSLNY